MVGVSEFIVNDSPVEGYGANVSGDNFSDDIHSIGSEYGAIVFSREFRISPTQTRTLILYFPSTWHSNTHGRTSATNAEIAGRNIIEGKWHDWWNRVVSSMAWDVEKELKRKVDFLYSNEMRKSRNEWNRITHTKDYQKIWRAYKSRIDRLKRQHLEAKRISEESVPDFWMLIPESQMSLAEQSEWVKKQRESFISRRKQASAQRSELWKKIMSLSSKRSVSVFKRETVMKFRTQEWLDEIEAVSMEIRELEAPVNRREKRQSFRLQDRLSMLEDPWSFGINAENALRSAARELVAEMKKALHGAKAPDLSERTKKNRQYRGNPSTPALDETGEFIESLRFDIL